MNSYLLISVFTEETEVSCNSLILTIVTVTITKMYGRMFETLFSSVCPDSFFWKLDGCDNHIVSD